MHTHHILLRLVVFWQWSVFHTSFMVFLLALGKSYDCPINRGEPLNKYMM